MRFDCGAHVSCAYIFLLPHVSHIHGGVCKKSIDLKDHAAADAHCHAQGLEHLWDLYLDVRKAQQTGRRVGDHGQDFGVLLEDPFGILPFRDITGNTLDIGWLPLFVIDHRGADLHRKCCTILACQDPLEKVCPLPHKGFVPKSVILGHHMADRLSEQFVFIIAKKLQRLLVGSQVAKVHPDNKYTFPDLIEQGPGMQVIPPDLARPPGLFVLMCGESRQWDCLFIHR